jgi:hypothetical protein
MYTIIHRIIPEFTKAQVLKLNYSIHNKQDAIILKNQKSKN